MHEVVSLHFATWHVQITEDRFTLLEYRMRQHMRCYGFCCGEPRLVLRKIEGQGSRWTLLRNFCRRYRFELSRHYFSQ